MSILKELKKDIKESIKKAGYEVETLAIETSNRKDLGEYQLNDAMQLAKKYKENPRVIAEKIVSELSTELAKAESQYEKNKITINKYQKELNLAQAEVNKLTSELNDNARMRIIVPIAAGTTIAKFVRNLSFIWHP